MQGFGTNPSTQNCKGPQVVGLGAETIAKHGRVHAYRAWIALAAARQSINGLVLDQRIWMHSL